MNRATVRRAAALFREALVRTGGDRLFARLAVGSPPQSLRARVAPGHLVYRPPTIRTVVRNGIRFELDISDYMQWCVYYGIAIEPRRALYALALPGYVAIDVGANVGEVLLNFARIVGDRGRAVGFEVNPATYRRCVRNVGLNAFRNVEVHEVGLGREKGRLVLGRPTARNSGGDRIADPSSRSAFDSGPKGTGDLIEVEVTTLDAFVAEAGIERVDLVKVDVEGFEMNVLRGAQATVGRFKPTLFVELDDANLRQQESSARELVGWLEATGYRMTDARQNRPVTPGDDFAGQHFDIIARPA